MRISDWSSDVCSSDLVMGIVCFYITYVCYRNLKSFLPQVYDAKFDRPLDLLDQAIFFGNEPAVVLHTVFGTSVMAFALSLIYLWFLPMVPLLLTGWLIWSTNISYGYWFATSQRSGETRVGQECASTGSSMVY